VSTITLSRHTPGRSLAIGVICAAAVFLDLVVGGLHTAALTAGLAIGAVAVMVAARQPGVALGIIAVFVPLQVALLALVFRLGAPAAMVKDLGYFKDAMTFGICIAALMAHVKRVPRRRLDRIDAFAGAYVGIATLYLAMPSIFPGSFGGQSFTVRINAWRLDCLFVILMVAARRIPYSARTLLRLRQVVIGVALVLCAVGIWEFLDGGSYNQFLGNTLRVPAYQNVVLHVAPPPDNNYAAAFTSAGNGSAYSRIGSLLLNPLDMGFYIVVPFGLAFERMLRGRTSLISVGLTAVTGLTLVLTETRSAVLGGVVIVVVCLWLNLRRASPGQLRSTILVVVALALAVPLSSHSTIRARFASVSNPNSALDNQEHVSRTKNGWHEVTTHPAGLGLGANPASGDRYGTTNATTTENSYLQVGSELGLAAMIAFIGLYLSLLQRLRRSAVALADSSIGSIASAVWFIGLGLLVGGMFLQVWIGFSVALTFWGLAGATLGAAAEAQPEPA